MAKNIADRMRKERNILERICEFIPGYGGYLDRERRRDADKLLRNFLFTRITHLKKEVLDFISEKTEKQDLFLLDQLDRIVRKIEKVADRIRFANYGYGGFFDQIKISAEKINKLYEFDHNLISHIENLKAKVDLIKDNITKDNLVALEKAVIVFDKELDQRGNAISAVTDGKE